MINVIPLFSVLNDDFKTEGGMIYPILNADYSDALGVGYVKTKKDGGSFWKNP